jgi:hypothetical protein
VRWGRESVDCDSKGVTPLETANNAGEPAVLVSGETMCAKEYSALGKGSV